MVKPGKWEKKKKQILVVNKSNLLIIKRLTAKKWQIYSDHTE